jgi:hypothetical protein
LLNTVKAKFHHLKVLPLGTPVSDIHRDLGIRMVTAEIKMLAKKHEDWLHVHTNVEATQLLDNERTVRGLSVVRVRVSVNSSMGATTVCSRHQMQGHTVGIVSEV